MKEVTLIIDIHYYDGTVDRGVFAHSLEFNALENIHSYNLQIYKTLEDVFKSNPVLYGDVKKIDVVGFSL